ncbi:MAG: hypothetical protein M1312_00030 [Patescibacteria group bacterium]|nr:hypothetical protein [Patescibacteria group bacterium]
MSLPIFEAGESVIYEPKDFRRGILFVAIRYTATAISLAIIIVFFSNAAWLNQYPQWLFLLTLAMLFVIASFTTPFYRYLVTNNRIILLTASPLFVGNTPSVSSFNFLWIYNKDILDVKIGKSFLDRILNTGRITFSAAAGPYAAVKWVAGNGLTPTRISNSHKLSFSLVTFPEEALAKMKEVTEQNTPATVESATPHDFKIDTFYGVPPASQIIKTILTTLAVITLFVIAVLYLSGIIKL